MIKAVIFDMDGVIIDSEPIYIKLQRQIINDLGYNVSDEVLHNFVGMSGNDVWATIIKDYELPHSVKQLKELEISLLIKSLNESKDLKPIHGIEPFIKDLLKKKYLLALASSSAEIAVSTVLNKLNFSRYFSQITDGEQVKKAKPDPEIFLLTSKKIDCIPSECLVIEDSRNGVIAAKSAGMKCIGYLNSNSGNQDLSEADLIINDFKELSSGVIDHF